MTVAAKPRPPLWAYSCPCVFPPVNWAGTDLIDRSESMSFTTSGLAPRSSLSAPPMLNKGLSALCILLLGGLPGASAYQIIIDLNTYTGGDLDFAAGGNLGADGTWAVTVNSPGTSDDQWSRAIQGIHPGGGEVRVRGDGGIGAVSILECRWHASERSNRPFSAHL
jgi:hypothetical protein